MFLWGELKLNVLILLDRLRASWKSRRWISEREYYNLTYDELKRGN